MNTGIIKHWNQLRGFGFIASDTGEPDIFVHISALTGSGQLLCEGQRVSFDIGTDARTNKEKAVNVRLI